jgi:hypothetical protein
MRIKGLVRDCSWTTTRGGVNTGYLDEAKGEQTHSSDMR